MLWVLQPTALWVMNIVPAAYCDKKHVIRRGVLVIIDSSFLLSFNELVSHSRESLRLASWLACLQSLACERDDSKRVLDDKRLWQRSGYRSGIHGGAFTDRITAYYQAIMHSLRAESSPSPTHNAMSRRI